MAQEDKSSDLPTRKWEKEELSNSRLLQDTTLMVMASYGEPLTRAHYLGNAYGMDEDDVPPELEAELPWDFQDPETRVPWEETQEPTLRDLQEYGLI